MHTMRSERRQSPPRPCAGACLVGAALALATAFAGVRGQAAESTVEPLADFRISFDAAEGRPDLVRLVAEQYAIELEEIANGSNVPVRIGIGVPAAGEPALTAASGRLDTSIWALFEHPNACNEQGCRLVHLYRDRSGSRWLKGFSGQASGELIRFFPYEGPGTRVACIQMMDGALNLFAWDLETIAPGAHC